MNTALAALLGAGLIAVATQVSWAGWQQREITSLADRKVLIPLQLLVGVAAAPILAATGQLAEFINQPGIVFAVAATLALGVTAILTDLGSHKIPKEPCLVAIIVGVAAYFATGGPNAWGTFNFLAAALGLVGMPFIAALLTRGGIGFGDIRLLAAFTATLSWWVGYEPLLWGVITACVLQGLIRLATRLRHAPKLPFGPALVGGITVWTGAALFIL